MEKFNICGQITVAGVLFLVNTVNIKTNPWLIGDLN
jgi:hypothetical protein